MEKMKISELRDYLKSFKIPQVCHYGLQLQTSMREGGRGERRGAGMMKGVTCDVRTGRRRTLCSESSSTSREFRRLLHARGG